MAMKKKWLFCLFLSILVSACQHEKKSAAAVWDKVKATSAEGFDLENIQRSGDLIAVTMQGPQTYYVFHGKELGAHFLLAEQFAGYLGVRLRMEVCRDTTEMLDRLQHDDVDIIVYPLHADSLQPGWQIGEGKENLAQAFRAWYSPGKLAEVTRLEKSLLSQPRVKRRVYAPILSKGVISHYDGLFRRYSRVCGWDWRMIAAQCYQESTFDPQAVSWAGARGLMQIMPKTADHLHLARHDIHDPEKNVAAACRLIAELNQSFSDIRERTERQRFVLAAYNGGHFHIRDAMRLAERDGRNPRQWQEVKHYVLKLSNPTYYRDSLVQYGYMRGQETVEYVDQIERRYKKYVSKIR